MASDTELGLELDFAEYDIGPGPSASPGASPAAAGSAEGVAAAATQVEDLGVQDLGVDDVVSDQPLRRPRPKLDADRLLDERVGYPKLLRSLTKIKYREGAEVKYLETYVATYQLWANQLWPKANFHDFQRLVRRASRDSRVRQYCRNLRNDEQFRSHGSADTNNGNGLRNNTPSGAAAAEDQAAEEPRNLSSGRGDSSALPPPASQQPASAFLPDSDEELELIQQQRQRTQHERSRDPGEPDDDEMEAALELYGDLGF